MHNNNKQHTTMSNTLSKPIETVMVCFECGEESDTCGWAFNDDETIKTFCCRFCDVDGSNYNGWADNEDDEQ